MQLSAYTTTCRFLHLASLTKVRTPIIIYGAIPAVSALAVKLVSLRNLHPIIAVFGKSWDHVKSIIDLGKRDVVIDYRQGEEKLFAFIAAARPIMKRSSMHSMPSVPPVLSTFWAAL